MNILLDMRDRDVPLSDLGHAQAKALGGWLAALTRLGVARELRDEASRVMAAHG